MPIRNLNFLPSFTSKRGTTLQTQGPRYVGRERIENRTSSVFWRHCGGGPVQRDGEMQAFGQHGLCLVMGLRGAGGNFMLWSSWVFSLRAIRYPVSSPYPPCRRQMAFLSLFGKQSIFSETKMPQVLFLDLGLSGLQILRPTAEKCLCGALGKPKAL